MKKILFFILALCSIQVAMAQHGTLSPQQLDEAIARRAVSFALKTDKDFVETNGTAQISVEIQVFDRDPATANPNDALYGQEYRYDESNPASEPYEIKNWKVLEQNAGSLDAHSDFATFTAPGTIPAGRCATISVELWPKRAGLAKIVLLQTVYIEDNPIAFYFDAPRAGINQEKYIIKPNDDQMNQLATMQAPHANASQQARLAALQAQLAQVNEQARTAAASKGINMDVAMSNAKAFYTNGITNMQFMGAFTVTKNARYAGVKRMMITLTFKGKDVGQYAIKRAKENTAYVLYMEDQKSFGCANDPTQNPTEKAIHCAGGNIVITSFTNGTFKGTVHAQLEGFNCQGTLDGKFTVKLATL